MATTAQALVTVPTAGPCGLPVPNRTPAAPLALVLLVAIGSLLPATARADDDQLNGMIGPVLGFQTGKRTPNGGLIGVEGGVGLGPERVNLGWTFRADEHFGYVELDPWYVVGVSLGLGHGSKSGPQPVVGLWEGVPLVGADECRGTRMVVTLSGGYRYTGVHEFYLAPKVGVMRGGICIH